jgi:hypothetical protein
VSMGQGRAWQRPVYDVHPSDQAIRAAVERTREAGTEPQHCGLPGADPALETGREPDAGMEAGE